MLVVEAALQRLVESDEDTALLWAQWQYDKRLVGGALQHVEQFFPHYSLHDASHSRTILTQIGRVLGEERVKRLSATDLWLLLEAAFMHDIGMVVSDDQLREWLRDPEFQAPPPA